MRKALIALLLLPGLAAEAGAQESASFLKIGAGARALGMGGAYTAIADDVNAMYWNPGGLGGLSKRELGATHAELVANTRYDFLGYAQPTKYGLLGAGAVYLSQGSLEGRDASGKPTGGFSASDAALSLSYAARLAPGASLGASVKYIQSSIAEASARSYALDLGGIYQLARLGPGIPRLGVAVQNMGPGMKFLDQSSPLPLTLAAGAGYSLPIGLTLAVDYKNRPHSQSSEFSVGTEYALLPAFALRGGYGTAKAASGGAGGLSSFSGFAMGFGIKAHGYSIDYAITPFGELGNAHRLSLGARF